MRNSRAKASEPADTQCSSCGKLVTGYDSVSYGSIEKGYRQLCWQCFNTEVAESDGLDGFEHPNFEPIRLVDCEGCPHDFHFRTRLFGPGVALDAFELRDGHPAGYQFHVIGDPEDDLFALLGRLVERIRRALSIKHLDQGSLGLQVAGQAVRGRIESDEDDEEEGRVPVVVIDGREITWDHFGQMLMSFEGWQFKLEILDKSEEA
ncbi:hypothetical protein [uncultured Paludibaculum sp.]|uniref:DUF7686 domain-containing protein n=1 Tax=uncultured Paludibaculum sp. TaxID=1765020 RepID=UPI002AAAF281|nr:hypothetical protein [uncultured Paludibaculum sp.]